ncbi:glucose PTS transporter subunit IIA, partial [Bacillus velezensis]
DYILPAMFLANMGQAGASFAVFLKSKNKTFKSLAFTTGITALMGITEPAMYGVNMRLKKPFAAALIGGAAGGAFYGITGVASYIVGGNAGLPSIPVFIGPTFLYALIGLFISFAAGIAAALLIGFEDVQSERDKASEAPGVTAGGEIIHSPIKGEVKVLSEVNDSVFSGGMMGKGFAILPEEGAAVSPVEGRVTAVFKTKHAIGITSARGAEVLIHIGLDTVRLDGRHFEMHVKEGDAVAPGDLLITFDIDEIKAAGFDVITPVIITNTDQYSFTDVKKSGMVKPNEALLALS